jgi:thioredoxin-like negative regulator of GroEL
MRFIHVSGQNNNAPTLNKFMSPGGADALVVQYYMDGCHHCNMLKPHWEKMTNRLKQEYNGNIVIAQVNANAVSNVNNSMNIEGYPTIRFIENGNNISDFSEERTSDNLLNWVKKLCKNKLHKRKPTKAKPKAKTKKAGLLWGGSKHNRRQKRKQQRKHTRKRTKTHKK